MHYSVVMEWATYLVTVEQSVILCGRWKAPCHWQSNQIKNWVFWLHVWSWSCNYHMQSVETSHWRNIVQVLVFPGEINIYYVKRSRLNPRKQWRPVCDTPLTPWSIILNYTTGTNWSTSLSWSHQVNYVRSMTLWRKKSTW